MACKSMIRGYIRNSGLVTTHVDQSARKNIQGLKGFSDRINFLKTMDNFCLHSWSMFLRNLGRKIADRSQRAEKQPGSLISLTIT